MAVIALLSGGAIVAEAASALVVPVRTLRVSPSGVDPNGPSSDPSVSADGRFIAFATRASNLGAVGASGGVSVIDRLDLVSGRASLISTGLGGAAPNASSMTPSISADGGTVAFASRASNLVAGYGNHRVGIFVRVGLGPIRLLSVGVGGVRLNGDSYQPAVSADGRSVAFTSTADNLVAGDDNAAPDVFVGDVASGVVRRVSVSVHGNQASGASSNPSISADGRFVSFASAASDLVPHDRNRVPDVFVRDRQRGFTLRASVSSRGREQNASVSAPFSQVSGLSADGRFVVFDSNATNLAAGDRSGHTNVYRHDLITGHTLVVSRSSLGARGDNDSFAPAVSADGYTVVFESFATNLAVPWAPGPSIFVRDIAHGTTLTLDVAPNGGPRSAELAAQLLQQPAISASGLVPVFASGAENLVPADYNGVDDLFARAIPPPATILVQGPPALTSDRRPRVQFRADDPQATFGLCDLDHRRRACPVGAPFRLPRLKRGRHVLSIAAGGPGMLFDRNPVVVRFVER